MGCWEEDNFNGAERNRGLYKTSYGMFWGRDPEGERKRSKQTGLVYDHKLNLPN